MLEIEISVSFGLEGPDCRACGATTRLCGTESHPVVSSLTLVTYVCPACGNNCVEIATLTSLAIDLRVVGQPQPIAKVRSRSCSRNWLTISLRHTTGPQSLRTSRIKPPTKPL